VLDEGGSCNVSLKLNLYLNDLHMTTTPVRGFWEHPRYAVLSLGGMCLLPIMINQRNARDTGQSTTACTRKSKLNVTSKRHQSRATRQVNTRTCSMQNPLRSITEAGGCTLRIHLMDLTLDFESETRQLALQDMFLQAAFANEIRTATRASSKATS
jgi:hypothetical protein